MIVNVFDISAKAKYKISGIFFLSIFENVYEKIFYWLGQTAL